MIAYDTFRADMHATYVDRLRGSHYPRYRRLDRIKPIYPAPYLLIKPEQLYLCILPRYKLTLMVAHSVEGEQTPAKTDFMV